ncbi:hypothetical protein PTTG_00418 [Puccinia triticina 1-1 BBBD Race 1]|uniref:Elongator complex protein 5 n=2 Tax=Puccinia triticina TaxID=208348 RepID=A0A180H2K8_PUCT1|nr:uncharacterized protein PtA15_8A518 [Puccinia triticina]OAV99247.1 hypothetical protein PTTG_00418 [Puccinia triticina 1-1 BBBD Race 1]WAQ87613.1 hypothetical protein PtA15_8A518 [Puccinia triticina]
MQSKPHFHREPAMSTAGLLLDAFLGGTLPARLVLLQDCPAQSAQPILHQLATKSSRPAPGQQPASHCSPSNPPTVLISHPSSLGSLDLPPSCARFSLTDHQDCLDSILPPTRELIAHALSLHKSSPVSIVVDSVQELFRLTSAQLAFRFLRSLLDLLPNPESRLIVVDSPHLQTSSSDHSIVDPSTALRSSSLSASYLHLKIHPTGLLDHLINVFGLPVPVPSAQQAGTHYDVRLFGLLDELAGDCNPYLEPIGAEKDRLTVVPQALMVPPSLAPSSANTGTCVIEWTAKNLPHCAASPSTSIGLKPITNKKNCRVGRPSTHLASIQHGLEALRLNLGHPSPSHSFRLDPLPLSKVLVKRAFKLSSRPTDQPNPTPLDGQLTFNLSLTDKQRAEREAVALPFLPRRANDGTVIEAPGEMFDGSFQNNPNAPNTNTSGMILYDPDSADDMDDEEPDDDF